MRKKQWGQFSAEFGHFTGRVIRGMSTILDASPQGNADHGGWNINRGDESADHGWDWARTATGLAKSFHTIALAPLRAELGQSPVILRARWWIYTTAQTPDYPQHGISFGLFRCVPGRITQGQATYRFRATGQTYQNDGYSPLPGADVMLTPFSTATFPRRSVFGYFDHFDITAELAYCLRANQDMFFLRQWLPVGTWPPMAFKAFWNVDGRRPYIDVDFLHPLEFFRADAATGQIDLRQLATVDADQSKWVYLGALERGETGTPVKVILRNFTDRTFPLVVVLRRHPRWTVPRQIAGSGTGQLDYVDLAGDAVWQRYVITFTSATAFSVAAHAYRRNPASLNPAGGGAGWTGTTGANWSAPVGGLTIPAAAWQPGTVVNDQFEVFVAGTDTDASWPADSDDQVEIAADAGGAPDAATWRPIVAAITRSAANVTIDAAAVKVPTLAVQAPMWPTGTRAFISDGVTIDHGVVGAVSTAAFGPPVFSGAGLNDLTRAGNFNGAFDNTFIVRIDGVGTPDTFRWSRDNGATWVATGVPITGAHHLSHGLRVTFGATTGHTLGDQWSIGATCWGIALAGLTPSGRTYGAGATVSTGLPIMGLGPGVWTRATASFGAGSTPANRIPVQSTSGFAAGQEVAIQDLDDPALFEVRVIASVAAGTIDLTANMANAYSSGAMVIRPGTGERPIWARAVATTGTAEEIKILRLGVEV